MAKLVYRLNQTLDGYVDLNSIGTGPILFQHFTAQTHNLAGSLYGRRMYEAMRYWDDDHPEWSIEHRCYAKAWRKQPKWVASRTLKSVGPNATLISNDVEAAVRKVKAEVSGEIQVGGADFAQSLTALGLIDEYQLYFRPVVLGGGKAFFAGPCPPLRLIAHDVIGEDAMRLTYVLA